MSKSPGRTLVVVTEVSMMVKPGMALRGRNVAMARLIWRVTKYRLLRVLGTCPSEPRGDWLEVANESGSVAAALVF